MKTALFSVKIFHRTLCLALEGEEFSFHARGCLHEGFRWWFTGSSAGFEGEFAVGHGFGSPCYCAIRALGSISLTSVLDLIGEFEAVDCSGGGEIRRSRQGGNGRRRCQTRHRSRRHLDQSDGEPWVLK